MYNLRYVLGGLKAGNREKTSFDGLLSATANFGLCKQEGFMNSSQGTVKSSDDLRLIAEIERLCEQFGDSDAHFNYLRVQFCFIQDTLDHEGLEAQCSCR